VTPAAPEAATGPVVAFDIEKIPVSEKPLGEFPFFTPPEGHKYVAGYGESKVKESSTKEFDRYYFATSQGTLHPVEGKTFRVELFDEKLGKWEIPEALRVERNYENAITAAGGVKVFDGKTDIKRTYETLDYSTDRQRYGPEYEGAKRQTYVIRRPDVEVWIEVSCSNYCSFVVAQKGEMKQTVGLIPASEMKAALDKEGHVALYINFDVDKATIRPDSEPIVAEIVKLLETNPDLKIRIEGHTDNTGADNHNQTLSENRAASVYGALLTKGIAQSRLQSAGFGASKPIADNASEAGKAKNRRVEIVKL
jgi:outer membrane protein OmpA-like peptidoglycan-associated protein